MLLTFLLFSLLILLLILKFNAQRYTKEGVPIVGNIPWLGSGIALKRGGAKFILEMKKKHGDVFQIYAGGKAFNFVFNEEFYSLFYTGKEDEMSFYEGIKEDNSNFHFDTILGTKTETLQEKRDLTALQPIRTFLHEYSGTFTEKFLLPNFEYFFNYVKKMQNISEEENNFNIDLNEASLYLASGFGASVFAGSDVARNPHYLNQVKKFTENALKVMTRPSAITKGAEKLLTEARENMKKVIEDAVNENKMSPFGEECSQTIYNSTGRRYGNLEIVYLIFAMIFALSSNTTTSLANSFVDILAHPDVKKKVLEELNEVIVNDPINRDVKDKNYIINQEMIKKLEFLQSCICETLRLFAPPLQIRKLQINLISDNGKLLIPKDSYVCTSPWIRHRDESIYENADVYDPTRFAKGGKQKRYSFLTFGSGRHHCLGKQLAETLISFTIASMLLRYDIQLLDDKTSSRNKEPKIVWFSFGVLKPAVSIPCSFRKL